MGYDNYDDLNGIEGQQELFPMPEKMFAVSNVFANAKKQMNVDEYKTFVYALTKVDWTKDVPDVVLLDKRILAQIVGVNSDSKHLSVDLHEKLQNIASHSQIHISDKDMGIYDDGQFITRITMSSKDEDTGKRKNNIVRIKFEKEYLSMFGNLQRDYITMWSSDIFQMKSSRSITFYEHLRAHSDTTKECHKGFGVKALKELFDIPKEGPGSYVRSKGGFDRTQFEKRILDPLCEDLRKCKMLQLVPNEDGSLYRKVRQGKRILGYEFYWNVSDRPRIADATEIKELRENIAEDPLILKISKDIAKGKKRSKEQPKKPQNTFNNFEQSPDSPKTKSEWEDFENKIVDN